VQQNVRRTAILAGFVISLVTLLAGCGPKVSLPHVRLPHVRLPHPRIFYRPEMILGVPRCSLNPLSSHTKNRNWFISLMYDSLVKIQPDGEVIPDIANSWSIRNHYTTYVFHLNPHAKWWNGRPISVHDVAWSYWLYANPQAPISNAKSLTSLIRGIHIINAGTVEIQLKYPDPAFLSNVAASGSGHPILPAFMLYHVPIKNLPFSPIFNKIPDMMGSGPYRPFSANAQGVKWVANPHYFLGAPKSHVLITTWTNSPAPDINWTSEKTDGKSHVLTYSGPSYYMLLYNSPKIPSAVGTALPEMINRLALARSEAPSFTPAYQPVIPGSPYTVVQPFQNPRAILHDAGYKQIHHTWVDPHGHKIDLGVVTGSDPSAVRLASAIHRQLTAAGWNIRVTTSHNLLHTEETHAFTMALVERRVRPYPLLVQEYGPRSRHNYGEYDSLPFRQSLQNILTSPNPTTATKEALTALLQSPPGAFLLWRAHHIFITSHVHGFRVNPFDPLSSVQNWSVTPSTRQS